MVGGLCERRVEWLGVFATPEAAALARARLLSGVHDHRAEEAKAAQVRGEQVRGEQREEGLGVQLFTPEQRRAWQQHVEPAVLVVQQLALLLAWGRLSRRQAALCTQGAAEPPRAQWEAAAWQQGPAEVAHSAPLHSRWAQQELLWRDSREVWATQAASLPAAAAAAAAAVAVVGPTGTSGPRDLAALDERDRPEVASSWRRCPEIGRGWWRLSQRRGGGGGGGGGPVGPAGPSEPRHLYQLGSDVSFVSPDGQKFGSRVEAVRHAVRPGQAAVPPAVPPAAPPAARRRRNPPAVAERARGSAFPPPPPSDPRPWGAWFAAMASRTSAISRDEVVQTAPMSAAEAVHLS